MRYAIPIAALLGLVCLALVPVPVIWGLAIAVVSLALIVGIKLMRWLDAALLSVLRRQSDSRRRRRETHVGTGIGRRKVSAAEASAVP